MLLMAFDKIKAESGFKMAISAANTTGFPVYLSARKKNSEIFVNLKNNPTFVVYYYTNTLYGYDAN